MKSFLPALGWLLRKLILHQPLTKCPLLPHLPPSNRMISWTTTLWCNIINLGNIYQSEIGDPLPWNKAKHLWLIFTKSSKMVEQPSWWKISPTNTRKISFWKSFQSIMKIPLIFSTCPLTKMYHFHIFRTSAMLGMLSSIS